jgi:hypothetical protein
MPQNNFNLQPQKKKRKIYSHLAIADQGGQRNCNGKTAMVLYRNVFY